jgi:hypothetical protein
MTDLEWLYAVLVLLYLLECGVWLRRGTHAWVRGWGRGWRMFKPSTLLGNARGGLVMASPLPPSFGAVLLGSVPPLSYGQAGLVTSAPTQLDPGPRPLQPNRFYSWDELRRTRTHGRRVVVDDVVLAQCSSQAAALELQGSLRRLATAADEERVRLVAERGNDAFDRAALENLWQEFRVVARPLAWCCGAYFVILFGLLPLVVMRWGLSLTWPALLVVIGGMAVSTVWLYRRAHVQLYPAAEEDRFSQSLMILLSPPLAVRGLEWLGRPLFERWHPLTLAMVFGQREKTLQLARRVLKELNWPASSVLPVGAAQAAEVERSWRILQEEAVRRLLRTGDIDADELLQPPMPLDDSCRSYCPRCDAQFTTSGGECCDCGGITLQPLPPPGARAPHDNT